MKIKVNIPILDYDKKPIVDAQTKEPVTYRKVFANALNALQENETMTGDQKTRIYQISLKLYDSDEVDLTVDQMSLIKDRVAKFYTPLLFGRTCELFGDK